MIKASCSFYRPGKVAVDVLREVVGLGLVYHFIIMWQIIVTAALWWVASTIASIASKSVMKGGDIGTKGTTDWTPAFEDLRWLELTALQHLLGGIAAVIWLKVVMGKSVWPTSTMHKMEIYTAALGNVTGNLATNAAYALVSSSMTQVVKACEPLFTFAFSMLLYKNYENLNLSTLLSIIFMIVGATGFVVWDSTFNVWGLVAAICSNIAFPLRNIYLKKLSDSWENPLQKYAVISIYGVLILLPILSVKFAISQALSIVRLKESAISSAFHFIYNLASITVLQSFSPLTHAILNLAKRVFVIVANIMFFHTPLSWKMLVGLLALFAGLFLYQITVSSKREWISRKSFLISIGIIFLLVAGGFSMQGKLRKCVPSLTLERRITTAWVFERPIPHDVITNIEALVDQNPDVPVYVYCGTTKCVHAITELGNVNIIIQFLMVTNIVRDTPLAYWLARHPFNKLLAGKEFENHLHEVVRLGLLWHYGGVYVDPTVRITGQFMFPECQGGVAAWVSNDLKALEEDMLRASYFPKKHPFIFDLAELYVRDYPKEGGKNTSLSFDFRKTVWNSFNTSCINCSVADNIQLERTDISAADAVMLEENVHYGTLSYDSRVNHTRKANLGDEIQGFPGLQFLPFVDSFVERDSLKTSEGKGKIIAFFNAWWGSSTQYTSWPPPGNIHPIMLSIHLQGSMQRWWVDNLDYLKGRGPIGCRDLDTLNFLRDHGADVYFSGCLTLMINNPNVDRKRTDNIYLVDVKPEFLSLLPSDVRGKAINVTHKRIMTKEFNNVARFSAAYQLIEMYASAKLVITQRIHCALPCVAMGTPVIFINSAGMPGGGGSQTKSSQRTVGLTPLFHTLDLYAMSTEDAKAWLQNFPWHKAPPNPNINLLMRLRATAWNVIRQNQALYDSARKFGLLPMLPPVIPTNVNRLVFHLLFTTSNESINKRFQGGGTPRDWNWRHWRCIESIFHHHPFAKVIVHSNTLLQSEFDVLTEAGYSVEVQSYSLVELLKGSPAQSFIGRLGEVKKGQHWYSHETDLLHLLILYKWGGVYMDTDVIIVRPVDSLRMNILAWQDAQTSSLSGAFMKLESGNLYLKACLNEFAEAYDHGSWRDSAGSGLLTRAWKHWKGDSEAVHVMHQNAFHMFHFNNSKAECFTETSGKRFDLNMKIITEEAYAVHLSSKISGSDGMAREKLKKGTICNHLLNSYCVLCNNLY